ncbi:MAG: MMPL family transporter [Solirubrobacterales bacterium]
MTPALYALGKTCARRGWVVVVLWVVLAIGLAIAASGGESYSDNLTLPGTDSQQATDLLNDKFPSQANGMVPVVFVAPDGKSVEQSKYKDAITSVYDDYAHDSAVRSATSPFSSDGADQISKDHSTAYIALMLRDSPSDLTVDEAQDLLDVADPAAKAGLAVSIGGYAGEQLSKPSSRTSEVIGLSAAVIILLLTFGTLVAMSMPIATAVFGLLTGLSLVGLLSAVAQVPTTAPALATMIGLGVGIDYGLFVVTQHRHQLAEGMEPLESAARATAIAGGAVVFAGCTVIIALLSLLVAGIPIVSALGYTSAIVVAVAMFAAITLLPAMLGLLGERINNGRLPWISATGLKEEQGPWHRWAELVNRHPWPAIVAAVVLLVVMTIPAFGLTLGQTDDGADPPGTQTRESYDAIADGFGPGLNGPLLVAVDLKEPATNNQPQLEDLQDKQKQQEQAVQVGLAPTPSTSDTQKTQQQEDFLKSKSSDPRLQDLKTAMTDTKDVKSVSQPDVNDAGTAAIYQVISKSAPSDEATTDLVNDLRDNVLPNATKNQAMTAYVGGSTAGYIDLADQIGATLPLVIGLVLLLSFVLLLVAFRSLLVPLKAVVMNLLSIGASFGVVTFVFSHDKTAQFVGLEGAVPIVSFVPLMMFAILFGLSMDYEVFLMTHVREEYLSSGDARRAVVEGLAGTARVITSAALIMVSVFCAFILNGDPNIKQFGVGMAAAVLIDATVVRCALVPGIMRLLGPAAWRLPKWLDRALPEFSIEGKEWFAERDDREAKRAARCDSARAEAAELNVDGEISKLMDEPEKSD